MEYIRGQILMVCNKEVIRNNQNGSLLIEVIIASVIIVLVGLSVLNSISTSNTQVKNTDLKANGLLALTAVSEKLAASPYEFCTSQYPIPNSYSSAVDTFNSLTRFNESKIEIANIWVMDTSVPSTPNYLRCTDLGTFETVANYNKIQWNIQKIDLRFRQGNEILVRSMVKTFDGRNQSFANFGKLKVSLLPQASVAPLNCPTTTSSSTNITIQTGEIRRINLGLELNGVPFTPSGTILFTVSNADPSPTTVQSTISGSVLTVSAPEFKPDALTRNPPGKLNIDIDAINLLTGEKALTAGIGITVNSLKIVDFISNSILNQNDVISLQTAVNATSPKIIPTVVTGGCRTSVNSGTYTFRSIDALPYGLRISSSTGEISGAVCLDSADLYPTKVWGPFNYAVSDSNSPTSSATNSMYLGISTARGIAPLSTLYIPATNKYGISISKSGSTNTSKYPIIKSCNLSLTGATYVAASASDGSGTVGLPSGITLNSDGLNGKPAASVSIGSSYTFYVKVTIGSATYVTAEPITLTISS
jgi:type II secretory pathway pseudopilin PulG